MSLLFFSVPMKICWKQVQFETIESHWGFISSRRLFLTFGNLNVIKYKIFVKTNSKRKKYENIFEKIVFCLMQEMENTVART